ncbi:MAG TPA: SpoIIE family protein phosphatase [Egibacteraceae bacterium]|nr:SpoIIE family protein phosphatase [Egibacteraceae bacterium]
MSLAGRVRLLLLAFFALLCLNAGLALVNVADGNRAQEEVERLTLALDAGSLLLNRLVEQETGNRGYLITGEDAFLSATPRIGAFQLEYRLRQILSDDPELAARVGRIRQAMLDWQEHAAREVDAAESGDGAAVARLVVQGDELSRALQEQVLELRAVLRRRVVEANLAVGQSRQRLLTALFSSFFTGAALLVTATFLLSRWVTVPLRAVSTAARAVAEGELDTAIPEAGPVDVAALGGDVERMRRRIIDELDTAVRAGEALAQHGPAVVSLHAALAPVRVDLPPTVEVEACLLPAEGQVAGDWYDLIPLERGKVALVVVDVSGHGAEAGVLALRAKQLLLASLRDGRSPGGTLDWVAANLGETGEMFLTAAVVEVNPSLGRCRYANAGHPPLLVAAPDGVTELPPTGPLLGPLTTGWATHEHALEFGSALVAYTDGLVEARDPSGREFGTERLISLVSAHRASGPKQIVRACVDAVRAATDGRLDDDLTIVALAVT